MEKNEDMKELVLKKAHDNDIKFISFWFTDVQGFLKSFTHRTGGNLLPY